MKQINWKKEIDAYAMLIIGSLLFAVGDIMFSNPYHLAPGGTWGLSNVLNAIAPWKVSLYAVCMDIPLLVIGTLVLGPKFGFKTILSTILIFAFSYVIEMSWGYHPVIHQGIYDTHNLVNLPDGLNNLLVKVEYEADGIQSFYFLPDYFMNTMVTGLIYGVAIGLVFKSGATSGGSDIISMILHKFTKISLGTLVMIVDGIITFTTMFISNEKSIDAITANLKLPLYSFIVVFIEGILIDVVVDGFSKPKTVFIITDKVDDIREYIIKNLGRGATSFVGKGMFEGAERHMIYVSLQRGELVKLKAAIHAVDPTAFVNILDSTEILGNGFKPLVEE